MLGPMFATTTWPTPESPAPAAPSGPSPEPGRVLRVRVTRHVPRTHRARRGVALPRIRRGDHYVVRVRRPDGSAPHPVLRTGAAAALRVLRTDAAAPHRARAAAA